MKQSGKEKGDQDQISLLIGLQVFHEEAETGRPKKHKQRVEPSLLRKANVISHKGQGERTWESNGRRESSGEKIKLWY